jgi:hypothetical protein
VHTLIFEQVSHTEARDALDADLRKRPSLRQPRALPQHAPLPNTPLTLVATMWLQALPDEAKAPHLAENHPRVTNQLAQLWGRPIEALTYLNELLLDRRCGRQGFPEPVVVELLHLHTLCIDTLPARNPFLPNDPWLLGNDQTERTVEFR